MNKQRTVEELQKDIKLLIKNAIEMRKLSYRRVEKGTGINISTLSDFLNDNNKGSFTTLLKLLHYLNLSELLFNNISPSTLDIKKQLIAQKQADIAKLQEEINQIYDVEEVVK